jgi:hypothetical protein
MFYNTSTATSKSSSVDILINSTGTCPADWRQWWLANGSDWPSVLGLHLNIVDSLRRSS